jgi:hypothetical protein
VSVSLAKSAKDAKKKASLQLKLDMASAGVTRIRRMADKRILARLALLARETLRPPCPTPQTVHEKRGQ